MPPHFPTFLASPEKSRQQEQGGGRAGPPAQRWGGVGGGGGHGAQRRCSQKAKGGRWGKGGVCPLCSGFPPARVSVRPTLPRRKTEQPEGGGFGTMAETHAWSRGGLGETALQDREPGRQEFR